MRKPCLFLFICLFSSKGFSQSLIPSTVGEIYNFEVGDTFERSSGIWGVSVCAYELIIITGKDDTHVPDSLIYYSKRWNFQVCPSNPSSYQDSVRETFFNLNNPCVPIPVFSVPCGEGDSCITSYSIDTGNMSNFPNDTINTSTFGCGGTNGHTDLINGLGIVNSLVNCYLDPGYYGSFNNLAYYHKHNGKTGGVFHDLPTGLLNFKKDENSVTISPNPVEQTFQLLLSAMPAKTAYFTLYDQLGKMVMHESVSDVIATYYRNNLNNGIYFWQVEVGEKAMDRGKLVFE